MFEQKRSESSNKQLLRVGRNNGGFVDMPVQDMYSNWCLALRPFTKYFQENIDVLKRIPLGAKVTSQHPSFKSKICYNDL